PSQAEKWDYDPTGNWQRWEQSADGVVQTNQTRVNNKDNQITQIDGDADGIAYDKAGNTLMIPPSGEGNWQTPQVMTWDAWNRLVAVQKGGGAPVVLYGYDGIYRRTVKATGQGTRHYYYNDQWKCVEEWLAEP